MTSEISSPQDVSSAASASPAKGDPPIPHRAQHQKRDKHFYKNLALGLVHEVRNPLSTIHVNLQLLREYWQEPITTKEKQALKKIETLIRETQRLEGILNTFFRFAEDFAVEPVRCNINQLVRELVDFLETEAQNRSIGLITRLDPALVDIYADPNLLKQAVYNLLLNALQATGREGQIILHTRFIPDRSVVLDISDTGPGIPPECLDKIFEVRFSTKKGNMGLGLPFVQQVIQRHQGRLSVTSPPKKGTTFTLELPLVSPFAQSHA